MTTTDNKNKMFELFFEDEVEEVFAKEIGFKEFQQANKNFDYRIIFDASLQRRQQELLEEITMKLYPEDIEYFNSDRTIKYDFNKNQRIAFKVGAKWQAERMYSEEDMEKAFIAGGNSSLSHIKLELLSKQQDVPTIIYGE